MTSAAQTPAGSKRAGAVPQAPPPGPLPDPLPHAVTGQERREPKRDNGRSEAQAPSSPERASVGEGDPRVVPAHARGARTTADSSRDALASLSRRVLQRLLVRAATSAGQTFALIRHGGVDLIETSAPVQGPPPHPELASAGNWTSARHSLWARFCKYACAGGLRFPFGPEGAFTCSLRIGL